jgi:hypothetical protein
MYNSLNRFILTKPQFDFRDVPMFFECFLGGGTHAWVSREFGLRMILAAVHDFTDYKCALPPPPRIGFTTLIGLIE